MGLTTSETLEDYIKTEAEKRGFFRRVPKGGRTTKDKPMIWYDALEEEKQLTDCNSKPYGPEYRQRREYGKSKTQTLP